MKGFLLDTNVPSETLRTVPAATVAKWFETNDPGVHFLSVVTMGELRKGSSLLLSSARRTQLEHFIEVQIPRRFGPRILPVSQAIAERWGSLAAERQLAGKPLGMSDGLIAATALEHDLSLVTRNTKDFLQLGLTLVNPWEPRD